MSIHNNSNPARVGRTRVGRRNFLRLAVGTSVAFLTAALLPVRALAQGIAEKFNITPIHEHTELEYAISAFTGDRETRQSDQLLIDAPEVAESGNVVPVEIDARALSGKVDQLAFFVANNPNPLNSIYHFERAEALVSFRIKMLESSSVVAVARLGSGTFVRNSANIQVIVGGCGG